MASWPSTLLVTLRSRMMAVSPGATMVDATGGMRVNAEANMVVASFCLMGQFLGCCGSLGSHFTIVRVRVHWVDVDVVFGVGRASISIPVCMELSSFAVACCD